MCASYRTSICSLWKIVSASSIRKKRIATPGSNRDIFALEKRAQFVSVSALRLSSAWLNKIGYKMWATLQCRRTNNFWVQPDFWQTWSFSYHYCSKFSRGWKGTSLTALTKAAPGAVIASYLLLFNFGTISDKPVHLSKLSVKLNWTFFYQFVQWKSW